MYLRTTKRKNTDGSEVAYYQLAHNERHPDTRKPVARVIHTFGRVDQIDHDDLVRLCRSIARVCGVEVVDPSNRATAPAAQHLDLPQDLEQVRTVGYGPVLVLDELWQRLGLRDLLRTLAQQEGLPELYEQAIEAMVLNRLCTPESKLGVWQRWLEQVYLPDCWGLKLRQMYEAMDLLYRHADEVETAAFRKAVERLDLQVDLVYFDTTTAAFAVDDEDGQPRPRDVACDGADVAPAAGVDPAGEPALRRRGRHKDGSWRIMVKVALAVTREGIPIRSWVLPGNTSDMTLIKQVRQDLKGIQLGRCLFVADSGFNSAENRRELGRAWGKYVLACRTGSVDEIQQKVLTRPGRYAQVSPNLRVKEVVVEEGSRRTRYLLCHNPAEARRQKHHREQALADLEEKLAEHPRATASAKWAIELQASQRYSRYLKVNSHGLLVLDTKAIETASKLDGKWVVETNDDTLTAPDTAEAYKNLLVIERCFRSLKQAQIQLAPFHHRLPQRLVAHVKLCVLALLLERVAEQIAAQPWGQILPVLETLQVTEYETSGHRFFRCNKGGEELGRMLESYDISRPKTVLDVRPKAQNA
jgi:hypothetical protein